MGGLVVGAAALVLWVALTIVIVRSAVTVVVKRGVL